jgi:hypothetical protein
LAALILLLAAVPRAALAFDWADGKSQWGIFLGDTRVGEQYTTFHHENGALIVQHEIDLDVPRYLVLSKRYLQRVREVWRDGVLVELTTDTNNYDEISGIDLTRTAQGSVVAGPAGRFLVPDSVVTSIFWEIEMTKNRPVLDLDSGRLVAVKFTPGALLPLRLGTEDVSARHVTVSGDLARELWYTEDGLLFRQQYRDREGNLFDFRLDTRKLQRF